MPPLAPSIPKPTTPTSRVAAAWMWSNTGDGVRTAIKYFERAIELDPTYAAPYTGLANAYSKQGL